jgi:hypothetical protein
MKWIALPFLDLDEDYGNYEYYEEYFDYYEDYKEALD